MAKRVQTARTTSGREWRRKREEGILLTLPSGNVARIRDVGFDLLLKLGRLPDALTPLVARAMSGSGHVEFSIEDKDNLLLIIELAENVCRTAFVEPRIVDDPVADDEISIDDLELGDKMFVLGVLETPARDLQSFRHEPTGSVEPLQSLQADESPAE